MFKKIEMIIASLDPEDYFKNTKTIIMLLDMDIPEKKHICSSGLDGLTLPGGILKNTT